MSAIPWIGQDIVESINIANICFENSFSKLFNSGLKGFLIVCVIFIFLRDTFFTFNLFKYKLPFNQINLNFETIGIIHKNALKKSNKTIRLDKQEYIKTPPSFLAFLVGLIDGDGHIQITKTPKGFIAIKLVISLHLKDISTLQYIHSVIKTGKINIYKNLLSPTCKLVINRTDLQEVLFPLLKYNNIFFLTKARIDQYNLSMYIFEKNIKIYNDIPKYILAVFETPKNALDFTFLPFFKNWIIGFANSEGSFFIKHNKDGCFQLKQKLHTNLYEALKLVFCTDRKINIFNNNNQFSVSSKPDIQKVINFFSFSGLHPLVGFKYIQYIKWLNGLRDSSRYNNLNYPNVR